MSHSAPNLQETTHVWNIFKVLELSMIQVPCIIMPDSPPSWHAASSTGLESDGWMKILCSLETCRTLLALIDPYCSSVLKEKNRLAQSNIFDLAKVFVACSQYLLACRPSKPKRHCWRCLRWNAPDVPCGKGEPQSRSYRLMSFNEVVHLSRLLLRIPKVFRGLRVILGHFGVVDVVAQAHSFDEAATTQRTFWGEFVYGCINIIGWLSSIDITWKKKLESWQECVCIYIYI